MRRLNDAIAIGSVGKGNHLDDGAILADDEVDAMRAGACEVARLLLSGAVARGRAMQDNPAHSLPVSAGCTIWEAKPWAGYPLRGGILSGHDAFLLAQCSFFRLRLKSGDV